MPEGKFIKLVGDDVPKTTDVVFIVEAKPCNQDLKTGKNIINIVTALQKELIDANVTDNRYAVVTFGGLIPFDKPRSIVHNNKIFTDANNLKFYFDHIQTGNGLYFDVFEAISVASRLVFRPGATKTFILLPCSACLPNRMRVHFFTPYKYKFVIC